MATEHESLSPTPEVHTALRELSINPETEGASAIRQMDGLTAADSAPNVTALTEARRDIEEAHGARELAELVTQIDFTPDKTRFVISNSHHSRKAVSEDRSGRNTRIEGDLYGPGHYSYSPHYPDRPGLGSKETWAKARDRAHLENQVIEQAGVRSADVVKWQETPVRERRRGLLGKFGFTKKGTRQDVVKTGETAYFFDYQFAAPAVGENEDAKAAGNNTGQALSLTVELSKDQATSLSKLLEADPTTARSVVDAYVRATGDIGKWQAELFGDKGNFYDPGKEYGPDFLARDVRLNYEAVKELKPEILGVITEAPAKALPEAA